MSGISATFQTAFTETIGAKPVTYTEEVDGKPVEKTKMVGGREVKFARLELERDLAVIAQAVIDQRKAQAKELFAETNATAAANKLPQMPTFDLFSILQKIQDEEPTIQELFARAGTVSGSKATIGQSLKIAGYSKEDIASIIASADSQTLMILSRALITCQQPKEQEEPKAEPPLTSTPATSSVSGPLSTIIGTARVPAAYPEPPAIPVAK